MNSNPTKHGKIPTLPLAAIQVGAAALFALFCRAGFLYVGVLGAAVVCATFALQIIISNSYWYFISIALSLSFSFLIGGFYPLGMCLCAIPMGIILAVMVNKKQTKVAVSLALMLLYASLFSVVFLVGFVLSGCEFSVSSILGYFSDKMDTIKDRFFEIIKPTIEEMVKNYNIDSSEIYAQLEASFEYLKLMLPAYILSFMAVLAYITACIFKLGTKIAKCELVLPDPKWETLPSAVCAWVYIGAYFIYFFSSLFSQNVSVLEVASNSIVTILTPIMLLMGVKWIITKANKGFIIAVFIGAFFFVGDVSLLILTFFGVRETLRRRELMKKSKPKN